MKSKGLLLLIMLTAIIAIIVVPSIPHHHHQGMIHFGFSLTEQTECISHLNENDSNTDTCCHEDCLAKFDIQKPPQSFNCLPQLLVVSLLFDDYLLKYLLNPSLNELHNEYHFLESLHGTNITRAFALRGPPCCFVA